MEDKLHTQDSIRILAHDINNKLTVVQGLMDISRRFVEKDPKRALKYIDRCLDAILKIGAIMTDIMGGKQRIINAQTELETIVSSLKSDYKLQFEVIGNQPLAFKSELHQFHRIVENIAKNAQEANATKLVIFVNKKGMIFADNGTGMPEFILRHIMSEDFMTTKENGHGLGTKSLIQYCKDHDFDLNISNRTFDGNEMQQGLNIMMSIK